MDPADKVYWWACEGEKDGVTERHRLEVGNERGRDVGSCGCVKAYDRLETSKML
jgi:hypothetical protein